MSAHDDERWVDAQTTVPPERLRVARWHALALLCSAIALVLWMAFWLGVIG